MTTIVTRQGKGSALTYEEMDSNLSNLKTDVESTQANVTAANARIQTTDANLGTISTTVTALESNAAGQANQITGANAAIVTANTALKNYVDGQVSTLSANAGTQQTTINTHTTDITDLRANITAANAVIATKTTAGYVDSAISTAVNNLINSAPGTLDTLGEIAANLATNADTVGAIVNSITSTNANVTAANAKIATLDANLGSATTNITTLFANAATQSTDISTLTANAASQTTALQVLDANLGTATTNITALQGNAGTQQTTINTHTSQIATLDANLGTATTNITALQGNAASQQTQINTNTAGISTINANLGAFETYANATFGTSSYGNANVAQYLPVYGGNIALGNVTANGYAWRFNADGSESYPSAPSATVAAGKMWYNNDTGTWNLGMGGGLVTQQVGEELYRYGKASSAITDSPLQLVYKTGSVGASGVITFAPAVAGITRGDDIIGCATESIATNAFGRVTTYGVVNAITTNGAAYGETWADNDDIYYNPATGGLTKTIPTAPGLKLLVGTVINAGSGGSGSFIVKLGVATYLSALSDVQLASNTGGQVLTYNESAGYWKNTSLVAGTNIDITPYTNGNITIAGTYTDANVEAYLPNFNGNIGLRNIITPNSEDLHIRAGNSADIYIEGQPGGGSDIFLRTYNGEIDIRTTDNYAVTLVSSALINLLAPNVVTDGKFTSTLGYFWANGTPYSTGSGGGTYSDANVAAYLTTQNISSANIGGSQTYANTQIQAISANIGSFYTYANATYSTGGGSTYGNANVAAYLPVYGGSITAYGVTGASGLDLTLQAASAKDIRILGADGGYSDIVLQTSQGEIVIDASSGFGSYGATMKSAALIGLLAPNVYTTGQFTSSGGYFWANGTAYSTSTSSYGNTNVAQYLPTYTGDLNGSLRSGNVYSTTNATITGGTGVFVASGAGANVTITGDSYIDLTGQSGIVINSTPRIDVHDGNLNVYKNTSTNANGSIYSDNNIRAGGNVIAPNFTFANGVNILSTVSGYIFSGDLAGNILYDSVRNRTFANAFPLSTPDLTINNGGLAQFVDYAPVYTSGVLAAPTTTNTNQTLAAVVTGNVNLRSSYQTTNNRTTSLNTNYLQVWMNTANTMTNSDRIRSGNFISEVKATGGQVWGSNTAQQTVTSILGVSGVGMFTGNGSATNVVGVGGFAQYTPASGGIYSRVATGVMGAVNINTNGTGRGPVYIETARCFGAFTSGTGGNVVINTAIGLHTHGSWTGATNRYAVYNEDTSTVISTNGPLVVSNATATFSGNVTMSSSLNGGFMRLAGYSAATLRTYVGSGGQIVYVSDGGGKLAYWDLTNTRWAYVSDDTAV